ncbi:MAG: aminodeoxychorismate synthase component I [Candidatus Omnitrophica bacterium]|nr:aminodeoxychorismate synthase component I [Candidatus Omnitrophota bacterium]
MEYSIKYKNFSDLFAYLKKRKNFVILYDNRQDNQRSQNYLFIEPIEIISCSEGIKIKSCFARLQEFLSNGYYAAGFLSYEAGLFFEDVLKKEPVKKNKFPLLWFGIYKKPIVCDSLCLKNNYGTNLNNFSLNNKKLNISQSDYIKNISKIKNYIAKGQTYQVNYTVKYKFSLQGSASNLFLDLCHKQHVHYAAFIDCDNFQVLSLSPELFFKRDNDLITLRPMKGTLDRGFNLPTDYDKAKQLKKSLKDQAENIMIVDLIRNDIGRVSESGKVDTRSIFDVEKYDTLLQMTSTVKSRLRKEISWYELFKSIFPSGSVTGAPKIQTMKIIKDLEKEPRYIYTGSIGFISPDKKGVFNVAIRTVLVEKKSRHAQMGIGGGIVWDSDPKKEYEECRLKSKFLTESYADFQLIETMLWRFPQGIFLLAYHLKRLSESAAYFGFRFNKKAIIDKLNKKTKFFDHSKKYRMRLLLSKDGNITIETKTLSSLDGLAKIIFSEKKTNSVDYFLFHKTTQRKLYDDEYKKYKRLGFHDVIFMNEKNQVTEGAISNILIKTNGVFYTPPLDCGLLNGTYRQYLLRESKIPIKEKILHKNDIINADKIFLTNAVRGMVEARIDG